jgi:hypothetical protein
MFFVAVGSEKRGGRSQSYGTKRTDALESASGISRPILKKRRVERASFIIRST